jgi:hypothetical protein
MRFLHNIPKRLFVRILVSVSLMSAIHASAFAQGWRSVHDGVEYAEVTRTIDNQPVRMNLLRLDLKKVRLDVVHAMDAAIGTETVSSMATRHNAIAAINSGFFRLDNSTFAGDPSGVLMIDGHLTSESTNDRTAVVIGNNKHSTYVYLSNVNAHSDVLFGEKNRFDQIGLSGINRQRRKDEAVLYSHVFGASTQTQDRGFEVSLGRCRRSKLIGSFRNIICKDIMVLKDSLNAKIPIDGYVISIGPDFFNDSDSYRLKFRDMLLTADKKRQIQIRNKVSVGRGGGQFTTDKKIDITNGVPQLIKDGKIDITWQEEKTTKSFVETRHPRTAVAKLKDGKFLMITVDGRSESSGGISLNDLAAYLLELGATDAMNLDGGGSTTMFLDGKVVNHPSDKEGERKVSDAILVTLRKK